MRLVFSSGLDLSDIFALKRVLQRPSARDDVTIVMTTPVPKLVEEIADRIAIIRDGELAAFDTVDGLRPVPTAAGLTLRQIGVGQLCWL